jgi:phosphoribosylanthranilate isomerase
VARDRDVLLAGGLSPANVGEAVQRVRPFGVDASSSLERSPGRKDHAAVRLFIEAVRATDRVREHS